jgi:hypothetical protein
MRLCRSVPSNQIRRRRRFSVFSVNSSFVLCIPPFVLTEVCLNYEHVGAAM